VTYTATRAAAAVGVAASLGVRCDEPVVLADGADELLAQWPPP